MYVIIYMILILYTAIHGDGCTHVLILYIIILTVTLCMYNNYDTLIHRMSIL